MLHIFNSIFLGSSFIHQVASIIMGLHYYLIVLDFYEMNSVLRVLFRVLLFGKYFFGFSVSGKVFVLGHSEIPNSSDPCL